MKKICIILTILVAANYLYAQVFHDYPDKVLQKNALTGDHETDERLNYYDVGFYFLDLEMDNTSTYVSGSTTIYLNLNENYNGQLVFDLKNNITHEQVLVNGVTASAIRNEDLIVIPYTHTTDFNENYQVSVQIDYHGTPQAGMFNSNVTYILQDYPYTYSLTEPYEAKYWFPCKQVLTDKADSSWVFLTIPDNLKAGSNGILTAEVPLGNNKKRVEWKSSYPIDYYLISVAVGDYSELSYYAKLNEYNDSVFVQHYYPNSTVYYYQYQWNMHRIDTMLTTLSHLWGIYPFHEEKYGHCIVDLGGGMEHQTMTTLGNFDFRLVVHELGHSWFGNYVTCATWQDIWVNEGFASYAEYLGEEFIQPDGYEDGWLEETQNTAKNAVNGSVYVPFEELEDVNRIFNYALSYRKGACLVHMLRYLTDNDEMFFASLRTFLNTYAHSTATGDNVKEVIEAETGLSLESFFNNWYYGEGYPIYNIEWYQTDSQLHIINTQTTTDFNTPFFEIPIEYELIYENGDKDTIRLEQTQNIQEYTIEVENLVDSITVDPDNWVLKELQAVEHTSAPLFIQSSFNVYPNPANEVIHINTSSAETYTIKLYSTDGKLMQTEEFTGLYHQMSIENLSPGIYIMYLTEDSGNSGIFKIIKE
jgi:aminopeptidase N